MEIQVNRKMINIMILTMILVMNTLDPFSAASTLKYEPSMPEYEHDRTFSLMDETGIEKHHKPEPSSKRDTANLTVSSKLGGKCIGIFVKNEECYSCDFVEVAYFKGNQSIQVNTTFMTYMKLKIKNDSDYLYWQEICSQNYHYMEDGEYVLTVSQNTSDDAVSPMITATGKCVFVTKVQPPDNNIPIYIAIGILIFLALCWILVKFIIRRHLIYNILFCMETERLVNNDLGSPNNMSPSASGECTSHHDDKPIIPNPRPQLRKRLKSLDTFRGVSIVVMIFVNYGGGGYWFFKHSAWNGLTVADLVFPWFIFIMGTSMTFAMKRPLTQKTTKAKIFLAILRRTLILFCLGIALNTGPKHGADLEKLRIPGVLQRFAVTYFVVATMYMFFARVEDNISDRWWSPVRDITRYLPEWFLHLSLLAVYLALTFGLEVPGCPRGYLGPGGMADHGYYYNCTGGAAGYIDRMVFGDDHIYAHPTCKTIYNTTVPYDPEGLLGCLTSIFLCFLGLQAGKILLTYPCYKSRLLRFIIWGVILGAIGTLLCKGTKNEGWIPINKNLWSVSFILCLAGMAFVFLAFCYYVIDVQEWWTGAPFFYPGMNSILLYVCHEVFRLYFPISWQVPDTHAAQLAMNLWSTAFWVIVAVYLHHKKIFLAI